MGRSWSATKSRERHRRTLAGTVLAASVLVLNSGCTSPGGAPADDHTFGMHQVISATYAGFPVTDTTSRQIVDVHGWERTESALDAMAWYLAGDCGEPAPVTEEFVVACDSDSTWIFLLQPAALTAEDVASASVESNASARKLGSGGGALRLVFTDEGAVVFGTLTTALARAISPANQVAIVVDGVVVTAPVVVEPIVGDSVGVPALEQGPSWDDLAAWLNN